MSPFSADVGDGQGSALSPILSFLFIALIFHIFEKRIKNLNILASFLSFVYNELFISQEKSFIKTNVNLFFCYNIMSLLLNQFGLVVKHGKTEIFHFSRSHRTFNLLALDLSQIGGLILWPKDMWKYLVFIFDKKLSFWQHINFYTNKALSTVKCIKILENLNQELLPYYKHLFYRKCVLSIALYSFLLWFYNKASLFHPLKMLNKIQRQATIWIFDIFCTFQTLRIEIIAGLIPIQLHLWKLSGRN